VQSPLSWREIEPPAECASLGALAVGFDILRGIVHRKSPKVFSIIFVVFVALALLWITQPACLGSTPPGAIRTAETESMHRKASLPKKFAVSPFERIFAPGLEKRLARAKTTQREDKRVLKSSSAPAVSAAPNFGGFVSAPLFSAEPGSACVIDPGNCGVNILAIGDFNKDGKPDLAIFQYDGTLNVLLNDGSGGFLPPVAYGAATAVANNYGIASVRVADVNNDGYPDLVALDTNNNQFLVFLNQKNGTFAAPLAVPSPASGSVGALAAGDVNHDGNVDVVVASYSAVNSTASEATVQTFLGNGDGTFANPSPVLTTVSQIPVPFTWIEPAGLALADVNNDGSLDLITVLDEYTVLGRIQTQLQFAVSVTLGNNSGAFAGFSSSIPILVEGPFTLSGCCNPYVNGIYPIDVNNDGKLDLVVDAGYNVLSLLGNGNGTFQSPVETAPYLIAVFPETLEFADITGDGYLDLIDASTSITVSPGNGDGTFGPPISNYASAASSIVPVDMNGDGILDFVGLEAAYRSVSVFLGRGDGTYIGAPLLTSPLSGSNPETLTLELSADVTGLGNADLIEVYEPEPQQGAQLLTGLSDGKGNFNYVAAFPPDESVFSNDTFIQPVSADFNGDGKQDIILSGPHGALSVALSNGDGTFQTPVVISLGALDCPVTYAAVGDLESSGKQSIVVPYPGDAACGGPDGGQSGYFVIPGNGDGTFGTPQFQPLGNELYSAVLANISGSGVLGLVLNDAPFDSEAYFGVYYLPGNGDGTFGSPATVSTSYMVSQVIAGDYNQDGTVDLIMFSAGEQDPDFLQPAYATAGILLYPGHGDGTFGAPSELGVGTFFLNGAFADVNGDGIPDIAAAVYDPSYLIPGPVASFGLSTFLGTGGGNFSAPVNFLAPDYGVESVFAGHFLSDNAPDIVLQTPSGTELLLNQGGTALTLSALPATITQGDSLTLTAAVQPTLTNRPAPSGTVNFLDNGTSLGIVPLSGGTATLAVSTLGTGSNQISANYSGDANFNPNTQVAVVNVTVAALPPAITLTSNPSAVTLSSGNIATTVLNLAANATFSGGVVFSVTNLPANVHAVVAPSTVTLAGGQSTTATLVLSGTRTSAVVDRRPSGWVVLLGFGLAGFLFVTRPAPRNRCRSSAAWNYVFLLLLTGSVLGSLSCGNSSSSGSNQPNTYNVEVNATPANSSAPPQTLYVTLTIQN
jgi:Bacterial Ig-like domain (group 3)/FG-GAP-like repeat